MKSAYQIIRRPVITEKGLAIKENQNTLVFQVAPKATKTEIRQAVQSDFQGESAVGSHRQLSRKRTPPRQVRRLPSGLEEGVRSSEGPAKRCRSTHRTCKSPLVVRCWSLAKPNAAWQES